MLGAGRFSPNVDAVDEDSSAGGYDDGTDACREGAGNWARAGLRSKSANPK